MEGDGYRAHTGHGTSVVLLNQDLFYHSYRIMTHTKFSVNMLSTVFNVMSFWCTATAILIDMQVRNSKLSNIFVYSTDMKEVMNVLKVKQSI